MSDVGKRSWEARELEELRAREATYRERLAHQAALAERLQGYAESLQRMLRGRPPSSAYLLSTLLEVAKLSSQALDIARTSVWLFDPRDPFDKPNRRLHCSVYLIDHVAQDASDISIDTATCPAYIAALADSHAVAVEDVYTDPRTIELEAYLRQNHVGALLDIPIVIPGALLGVVCHEHVGPARVWHREEIDFAANVGSLVALALETERRLTAEHAAHGTDAKYRHLVESLPVTVYSFDFNTSKLDYVSPHVATLSAWTPEQWLAEGADHWIERIHPDDRQAVLARFKPGALSGQPEEITYRVKLPSGQTRWLRDTCSLVRDPVGRSIAVQGVLCDVTRQIEAELARTEWERRYRFFIEHADLHAVLIDADARLTFVNDYWCRATGFARESVLGHNWFEITAPPSERPRLQAEYRAGLERGWIEPRMEASLRSAAGDKLQILWTNTLLRGTDGLIQGVLGVGVDLTQRQRLEAELLQQTKLESLGRLAAGVAHDFNNLLTVMSAHAEHLAALSGSEAARSSHRAFMSALQQAADLTHSLLVYGRKDPVSKEALLLDELIDDTLPLATALSGGLEISLSLACPDARVLIDRAQVRQVILNLVVNATDATRGVGSQIRISTHLELVDVAVAHRAGVASGGEYVVLTVADDGCGMDVRTVARVFEPFFTTKAGGRGTGLGLAMCQSIVASAGGFIHLESAPGSGTRFGIYLPRAANSGTAAPTLNREDRKSSPVGSYADHTRVLVVDDEPAIRAVLTSCLRDADYRVFSADTVASATQILASQPIDLLLTDGNLPDGSGVVLARSARIAQPHLKVILASGSLEGDRDFDAVLIKPFHTDQLLRVMTEVLDEI